MADAPDAAYGAFLDRLMMAESAGRNHAKNPRSSALGPFQFIDSTWIAVMRKHFPEDIENKSRTEILALRTDRDVARRAAEAFSKDNHEYLVDRGLKPTFGHLRLAFLLGASGAAEVLEAPPKRSVRRILGNNVVRANPFMRRMSAADLVARATRDVTPKRTVLLEPSEPKDEAPAAQPEPATRVAEAAPAQAEEPEQSAQAAADARPMQAAAFGSTPAARPAQSAEVADAKTASAAKPEEPAAAAEPRPAAHVAAPQQTDMGTVMGTVHPGESVSVINVKCDSKLASCKRWIDEQVARLIKISGRTVSTAERDARDGA